MHSETIDGFEITSYMTGGGPVDARGKVAGGRRVPGSLGLEWPTGFAGGGYAVRNIESDEYVAAFAFRIEALEYVKGAAAAAPAVEHRIRHFVVLDGELVPRTSSMRGAWACEAKCSCGWETRTGGAVRSYIEKLVDDHKLDVRLGV